MGISDAGLSDVIDSDGGIKDGKAYGSDFVEGFKNILSKMGPVGKTVGAFFNIDKKSYEEMTEIEQWLNKPSKKFIELAQKGEASGWDLLKAIGLEALHEFPIVAEIEALLNGDGAEFIKSALQTGLLFNPVTWPIGLLWKGFDILSKFKDENDSWDTLINFLGLNKLKDGFTEAADWLYSKLSGFGSWLGSQVSSAISNLNPINIGKNISSWVSDKVSSNGINTKFNSGLGSWFSGGSGITIPKYAEGGFMKASHIAQVDPNEVALPLTPSILGGIGNKIVESTNGFGSGGGSSITVNVHLGQDGVIIADNYSLQKFSRKIGENVAQQLKSTGQLNYGRKY